MTVLSGNGTFPCGYVGSETARTLQYGSSNGGLTVYDTNPELNELMKNAGKELNIKCHIAGKSPKLDGPVDIEGHKGKDEHFYVIDLARVYPPTAEKDMERTFLYKLFRPEFVKNYRIPLVDGFSTFGKHNEIVHNNEIKEATEYLLGKLIPTFCAHDLPRHFPSGNTGVFELDAITEELHRAGINVRYLGHVRFYAHDYLKPGIFNEICARVIKNYMRDQMREVSG